MSAEQLNIPPSSPAPDASPQMFLGRANDLPGKMTRVAFEDPYERAVYSGNDSYQGVTTYDESHKAFRTGPVPAKHIWNAEKNPQKMWGMNREQQAFMKAKWDEQVANGASDASGDEEANKAADGTPEKSQNEPAKQPPPPPTGVVGWDESPHPDFGKGDLSRVDTRRPYDWVQEVDEEDDSVPEGSQRDIVTRQHNYEDQGESAPHSEDADEEEPRRGNRRPIIPGEVLILSEDAGDEEAADAAAPEAATEDAESAQDSSEEDIDVWAAFGGPHANQQRNIIPGEVLLNIDDVDDFRPFSERVRDLADRFFKGYLGFGKDKEEATDNEDQPKRRSRSRDILAGAAAGILIGAGTMSLISSTDNNDTEGKIGAFDNDGKEGAEEKDEPGDSTPEFDVEDVEIDRTTPPQRANEGNTPWDIAIDNGVAPENALEVTDRALVIYNNLSPEDRGTTDTFIRHEDDGMYWTSFDKSGRVISPAEYDNYLQVLKQLQAAEN